jgi:hypothetical protein
MRKELIYKTAITLMLFAFTFLIFKLLEKPAIYNATLKNITHTYNRDTLNGSIVYIVNEPYYYRDVKNTCRWDSGWYSGIKDNYYNGEDSKYAFFPLFPLVWKISHINILYIGLFNYLLFALAAIFISGLFFKNSNFSLFEKLCVFSICLTLPSIIVYYLPYAEGLFTFTFVVAIYGIIKNKYWIYFIAMLLFSMTRPTFVIVGLSFIILDTIQFIRHKNIYHFTKELSLKIQPIVLGTFFVFLLFYLNSGSFTKYFESINKNWNATFSIPTKIADWSVEGFGMNVFTIFFILTPSIILFTWYFIKSLRLKKKEELKSIFTGNIDFIKEYFFLNSIIYFWGVFLFILFFQGGFLNGLNRYIIASPYFLLFFFYVYEHLNKIRIRIFLISISLLLTTSLVVISSNNGLDPPFNFNDSGFFTLFLSFVILFLLRFFNNYIKVVSIIVVIFFNIIWITYLYNIYLCDGWIYT